MARSVAVPRAVTPLPPTLIRWRPRRTLWWRQRRPARIQSREQERANFALIRLGFWATWRLPTTRPRPHALVLRRSVTNRPKFDERDTSVPLVPFCSKFERHYS